MHGESHERAFDLPTESGDRRNHGSVQNVVEVMLHDMVAMEVEGLVVGHQDAVIS
jgi:hypothetical protein